MNFEHEELKELYDELKETNPELGEFGISEGITLENVYVIVSKKILDCDKNEIHLRNPIGLRRIWMSIKSLLDVYRHHLLS